jgi:hypothetical protein
MKANTDLRDEIALTRHTAACVSAATIKRGSKRSWLALLTLILPCRPGNEPLQSGPDTG